MLGFAAILVAAVTAQVPRSATPGAAAHPKAPLQDLTLPPETAQLVTILEGRGTQKYACTATAAGFQWTSTGPEAQLFNLATGKVMGHHDAGPTWTLADGSSVRGTMLHSKAADTPGDVPWLLLQAQPAAAASETPGMLTHVTLIRRYNTHGGNAPATLCDAGQQGQTAQVPYTAMYSFYSNSVPSPLEQTMRNVPPAPAQGGAGQGTPPQPAATQAGPQ